MKKQYITIAVAVLISISTTVLNAGPFKGVRGSSPVKNEKGEVIETELPDPYSDFTIISETLFENDQLIDVPGRLVAIAEDSKGATIFIPYAEFIQTTKAPIPEVKVADFVYDSYLIDTKSAVSLGLPVASAELSGDYKVEYKFYRGATCRMSLRDIDGAKYNDIARRAYADVKAQGLKFKAFRIISSAASLHSAYSVIKGVKADANVSGLGWKVGGSFYSSQQMNKNRVKIGVNLVSYAGDASIFKPTEENALTPGVNLLPGRVVEPVQPESIGIDRRAFPNVFKVENLKE
jgi:hypothetical protein